MDVSIRVSPTNTSGFPVCRVGGRAESGPPDGQLEQLNRSRRKLVRSSTRSMQSFRRYTTPEASRKISFRGSPEHRCL